MTDRRPMENRLGALISAYADRAPTSVDPMAVTRSAAAGSAPSAWSQRRFAWPNADVAFLLLVLALLATIAAVALVAGGRLFVRELEILDERVLVKPFNGLPPEGAAPSTPETGELVLEMRGRLQDLDQDVHAMWVYSDGRLIWRRSLESPLEEDRQAFGHVEPTTAILEQELTLEGIQLLQSEVLRPGTRTGERWGHGPGLRAGGVWVRIGGRMESVHWLDRSVPGRLANPATWLPLSAWADQRIGAYVPTRYSIGVQGDFDQLPDPVRAVLQANGVDDEWSGPPAPNDPVTIDSAREIVAVVEREGRRVESWTEIGRGRRVVEHALPMGSLFFEFGDGGPSIVIEPVLPHGEVGVPDGLFFR